MIESSYCLRKRHLQTDETNESHIAQVNAIIIKFAKIMGKGENENTKIL